MSNLIFPDLPGLTWNVVRQPEFKTRTQKAISGREVRLAFYANPMYLFKMTYDVLREGSQYAELKALAGFFVQMKGSYDSFLYQCPGDSSVTDQTFGVGNGSDTVFNLARPFGSSTAPGYEVVQNPKPGFQIYKDGVLTTAYTVNSNNQIVFTLPVTSGVQLTWTGEYYYRVRFNMDAAEFNQFMQDLWELKKCELYGSLANKV